MSGRSAEALSAAAASQRILELKRPTETDREFAQRIGLSPQQISNYRAGSGASVEAVAAVVVNSSANPRWILTGEGPTEAPAGNRQEEAFQAGAELVIAEVEPVLARLRTQVGLAQRSTVGIEGASAAHHYEP